MKRFTMMIALLLFMVILIACAGPSPVPVIIQSDRAISEPKK